MSTAQLTVLWYAGLAVVTILLFEGDSLYSVAAIILLAALLIYTLKPHPQVRKGRFLLFVVGPFVALGTGWYGWSEYEQFQAQKAASLITLEQIEVMNLEVESSDDFHSNLLSDCLDNTCDYLTGTVLNRSSHVLTSITLDFGRIDITVALFVPPGRSHSFKQVLTDVEPLLLTNEKGVPLPFKIRETRGAVVERQ